MSDSECEFSCGLHSAMVAAISNRDTELDADSKMCFQLPTQTSSRMRAAWSSGSTAGLTAVLMKGRLRGAQATGMSLILMH